MNQYTLDYFDSVDRNRRGAGPRGAGPRGTRPRNVRSRQRMYQTYRRMIVLLSGLVCGIALVSLMQQRAEIQMLRQQFDAKVIQYDSLLAAKGEIDQQVNVLHRRLLARERALQPTVRP